MRRIPTGLLWIVFAGLALPAYAQDCRPLEGAWTGVLPVRALFEVRLAIHELPGSDFEAEVRSAHGIERGPVWLDGQHLRFQAAEAGFSFDGLVSDDGSRIEGFLQAASHVSRVSLAEFEAPAGRAWATEWSFVETPDDSARFDLYIADDGDGGLGGYFFFRDQRLPGLWGYGLECSDGVVRLGEKNLGLWLEGRLTEAGTLEFVGTGAIGSAAVTFQRMSDADVPDEADMPEIPARPVGLEEHRGDAPPTTDDGWVTTTPAEAGIHPGPIADMVRAVVEGELAYTHSVLVARHGYLAVEEYFYGFDRETLHDMRSASKTVTSTLIGLAIQEGRIVSSADRALAYFPNYRRYDNWDPRKAEIELRHLLTMSSGLDANDSDYRSAASEGSYQSQTARPDWIKLALDAPMLEDPGTQPLYGGANPMILGGVLANVVDSPVEWFAHRALFEPLGIDAYRFFLDPMGVVYMGGGLHLRPRDMAKYGQMYLDGGVWQGRRILDEAWIDESWGKYGRLRPLDRNGHQYGYLWWHHVYEIGDAVIETVEARGNGGQYIFVAPSLDLVVVITSGNFRNGLTREPEEILRSFILPAVLVGTSP